MAKNHEEKLYEGKDMHYVKSSDSPYWRNLLKVKDT
jgi:hypothetical protein